MIRGGFLSDAGRQALTAMARDGLAEHRVARRANAIVLLDKGWSCARVAGALLLDDDTVREWFQAYETGGLDAFRPRRQFVPAHSRTASGSAKLDHRTAAAQHADHRCLAGEEPWLQLQPARADRAIASPRLRLPQASQYATRPQ